MEKKRIYQVSKEFNISSDALLKILRELRFDVKSHMSVATDEMVVAAKRKFDVEKENAKRGIEKRKKSAQAKARAEAEAKRVADAAKAAASSADDNYIKLEEQIVGAKPEARSSTGQRPGAPRPGPRPGAPRPGGAQQGRGGGPGTRGPFRPGGGPRPGGPFMPGGRRRRRKRRRSVNQSEVSKSFRSTMATMAGPQKTKKYRKRGASEGEFIDVQNIVDVTEFMTVGELGKTLDLKPADLIQKMFELGQMATINHRLDIDTIEMLCLENGFGIQQKTEVGEFAKQEESPEDSVKRPPVITVMGHVDHGKTSLLDYLRKTDVVSSESGSITQHIGAYQITSPAGEKLTFLDTPGHQAFTAIRALGAQVTDLVILVVAADDAVMPQTVEAIDHAKAAGAPIVVAINKIDKPEANVERIKQELTKHGLVVEEWGGDTVMAPISAKTGEGIDKLIEMVVLTADLLDLKADPNIRGQGVVIEARLEKGKGAVATALVMKGSVEIGSSMVAGSNFGRVRTLSDDRGEELARVGPGTPVQITGLDGVPQAGDSFLIVANDAEAREISSKRAQIKREYDYRKPRGHATLENIFSRIKEGQIKELAALIKGDVDGSVEVLAETMTAIQHDEVRVRIVHKGVGAITESDVLLAATSDAIIFGFHVGPTPRAREVAAREHVDIRHYEIIYEVENDVRKALEGMLAPTLEERHIGRAEVRDTFKAPKVGQIAGCYVQDGTIKRIHRVNLMRDGKKIYTGDIDSLRRFKDDVREVESGYECGIHIENFNDIKVGDVMETFEIVEVARTLQER
ncbi:MAG: translation initiation factor IF-2 [candidate division Zixibacteria bacterium]|nr:translation initiation factor IF-2 [candidate division Zixibacteria bacterium]